MIFTTFDIAALLTVLVCLAISAMRGLMGEVVSFVGWIVALILARALAVPVSDIVFTSMNPRPMAVVCAFVLVYIVARIGIVLLHQVLDLVVKKVKLSGVNRMLGGILGMSFINSVFVDAMAADNNDDVKAQLTEMERKIDRLLEAEETRRFSEENKKQLK